MSVRPAVLLTLVLFGCQEEPPDTGDTGPVDADQDGWTVGEGDCDDADPDVHPEAEEICGDGVDNNCNGSADGCGLWGDVSLAEAGARLDGEGDLDLAGDALTFVQDLTGDGHPDLVVGGADRSASVYLVSGLDVQSASLSEADAILRGSGTTGSAVADGGDLNQDGSDELLAGEPGGVYVISGPLSGEQPIGDVSVYLVGDADDNAGTSVAGGRDVSGDGLPDLVVGARFADDGGVDAGMAYILYGPILEPKTLEEADASLRGEDARDLAGLPVALAGDVDGDGIGDVLVGAEGAAAHGKWTGAAYLVLGPIKGLVDLSDADARIPGEDERTSTGAALAGLGDLDGDGRDEFAVAAPSGDGEAADSGVVYVFLDPPQGSATVADAQVRIDGVQGGENAGSSLAAGDVDGDGVRDLLAGAPRHSADEEWAGGAYLVYGPLQQSGTFALSGAVLLGEAYNEVAGCAVASGTDLDADGYDEVLVGASQYGGAGDYEGAVYLLYGGTP
ncbi:MAG: FG-GAP repeat protein [Deltaproteobacteria bacterium]|nr:FG-GAP repeat protein [Deltaproteobacteria bacterium]